MTRPLYRSRNSNGYVNVNLAHDVMDFGLRRIMGTGGARDLFYTFGSIVMKQVKADGDWSLIAS